MTLTFPKLGLAEPILKILAAENYTTPTPIQAKAIPVALEGRDVFGIAQTGTGKTAAFALPIIDRLMAEPGRPARKGCRALILSPTRELATQIAASFRRYSQSTNLTVTTVFGGVGANPQIKTLSRGVDILVATPGRLLDHMGSGHCDLSETGILVLDEADQMLDLGFLKPIKTIAAATARDRQSLFFSATLPKEIEMLSRDLLRNPVSVRVTPVSSTAERIDQKVIHVARAKKAGLLVDLLGDHGMVQTLVFTRTKRGADTVTKHLAKGGLKARAIHGNKSQNQRQQALDAFRNSKIHVLVATDIAARGIDIPDVTHVVNYDLPEVPESYVHRIGRTARAGRSGEAISLCDPSERKLLRDIERVTKQSIPSRSVLAPEEEAERGVAERPGRSDRSGGRNGRGGGRHNAAPSAGGLANGEGRKPRHRRADEGDSAPSRQDGGPRAGGAPSSRGDEAGRRRTSSGAAQTRVSRGAGANRGAGRFEDGSAPRKRSAGGDRDQRGGDQRDNRGHGGEPRGARRPRSNGGGQRPQRSGQRGREMA